MSVFGARPRLARSSFRRDVRADLLDHDPSGGVTNHLYIDLQLMGRLTPPVLVGGVEARVGCPVGGPVNKCPFVDRSRSGKGVANVYSFDVADRP